MHYITKTSLIHMPKVSIIIPTYNSSRFIKRTIGSVLAQTFRDWELIIVDDCSKDNTELAVKEFAKIDKRIKFFKTPKNSGGPATPKNIGIEKAEGEYIAFLDHDDEWFPEKLEKQLRVFENSKNKNLGLVSCYFNIRDNNTNKIIYTHTKLFKGDVLHNLIKGNFIVTCSNVFTKKSILEKVGLFDINLKVSDDWDMWLRIVEKGYTFDYIQEPLLNYFIHQHNACYGNKNLNEKKEFAYLYEKHLGLFKENIYIQGYYYNSIKNYRKSRKYYFLSLFKENTTIQEKIKAIGYIFISFFPFVEVNLKKAWRKLKQLFLN